MPPPTILAQIRQSLGRALRETGQALDRVGSRGRSHAESTRRWGDDPYKFEDHLSRHRNRMPLLRRGCPQINENVALITPCSSLIGSVCIGEGSSVWYGSILKADTCNNGMGHGFKVESAWRNLNKAERAKDNWMSGDPGGGSITVGKGTNIQDGCIVTAKDDHTIIGDGVTVGHCAQIHSSKVNDNCLIGMGSILQSGSVIDSFSFIAAGAVVGKGVHVPSGELWVGNPARKLRDLSEDEKQKLIYQAEKYVSVARNQNNVMELGGNMSNNTLIDDHLMIPNDNDAQKSEKQQTSNENVSHDFKR
uniref:Uncharacterized protein n=1 Tax=Eucampia antarctica TaxID=49252 RepID=A0A7S2S611_9STRA|mmetsp:Transcript_3505/g.3323  ORF Transcript_3505/g.3323 Transcript_3505/m.3323 type:complete len:306 (+) Transcript_3505:9-926(+)